MKSKLLVLSSKVLKITYPEFSDHPHAEVAEGGVRHHHVVVPRPSGHLLTSGDSILLEVNQARVKPLDKNAKDACR